MFKFRFRIKKGLVPGSPAVYMGLAKVLPRGIGLSQGTPIFGRSSHDCIGPHESRHVRGLNCSAKVTVDHSELKYWAYFSIFWHIKFLYLVAHVMDGILEHPKWLVRSLSFQQKNMTMAHS